MTPSEYIKINYPPCNRRSKFTVTILRTVKGKQFGSVYCSLIRLRLFSGRMNENATIEYKNKWKWVE